MGMDGWLVSVLNDVNKFKCKPASVQTQRYAFTTFTNTLTLSSRPGKQGGVVCASACINSVKDHRGQPVCDPCPTIKQIKTTLITRLFNGCINLE